MTLPLNTQIPIVELYEGRNLPALATAAVVPYTFAAIAGPRDTETGAVTVTTAAAAGPSCGVVKYQAAAGGMTGLARGNARIVYVTAGAAITAGQDVEVGANGAAVPHASGIAVAYAVDTVTTAGTLVPVSLY